MLDQITKDKIRNAFKNGSLFVDSVKTDGSLDRVPMENVMQHFTPHKKILSITLETGEVVQATEDHSLFMVRNGLPEPLESLRIVKGTPIAVLVNGCVVGVPVASVEAIENALTTYDLSVPPHENFILSNGIVAHNSYSIGGVSLDIQRVSNYETLKQNSESQFDKATQAKADTVKYIRGIQQPRYGLGVRSAFGPHVGSSRLSPRNFF